ncbi:MAG: hypothetical protein AAGI23_03640 [Bacteroidota bacterium]
MLQFDILDRSIEVKLSTQNSSLPHVKLFMLVAALILLLPKSFDAELFWVRLLMSIGGVIVLYKREIPKEKSDRETIKEHTIDRWTIQERPFIIKNKSGEVILDANFKGTVHLKYEMYYHEVRGYDRHGELLYGTKNQVVIEDDRSKRSFYIFMDSTRGKDQFYQLAELFRQHRIEVKEYTKGIRTHSSK